MPKYRLRLNLILSRKHGMGEIRFRAVQNWLGLPLSQTGRDVPRGIMPQEIYRLPWRATLVLGSIRSDRGELNAPIASRCCMTCRLSIRLRSIGQGTPREPPSTAFSGPFR
jgi:hypothetical protein